MDSDTRRDIEDLKSQLKNLQAEEDNMMLELEKLRVRKIEIQDRIKELSNDDKYQQNMLEMVYQQRQQNARKHE